MSLFTLSPLRAALILLVMSVLAFAPGISNLPVLDRDEARFAQASRQMMFSQDYVDIRFQHEARHKKPVGIYWAQVISSKAFDGGNHEEIWPFRVPSLIGAIMAVLFTFWGARAVLSTSGAFTAGLILLSSILLMAEARIAKTDASLLFTICMAQAFLVHILQALRTGERIRKRYIIGFWIAIGGGILLKGPITPMVLAFTIFGLCISIKDWRIFKAIKPVWGLGIVLLICAPWFIAITIKSGGSFFAESVGKDLVAKVGSAQEKHGAPPLTYLALLPILFWPWAGVFLSFIGNIWKLRQAFVIQWIFWWAMPVWLIFELIPTKLPHYVLPAFPALAIGIAYVLHEIEMPRWRFWQRILLCLPALLGVTIVAAASIGMQILEGDLHWPSLALLSLAAIISIFACIQWQKQYVKMAVLASVVSGIVMGSTITTVLLPNLPSLFLSDRIAEVIKANICADPFTGLVGYYEPSIVFRLNGNTDQLKPHETASFMQFAEAMQDKNKCNFLVLDRLPHPKRPDEPSPEATFLEDAARVGMKPVKIGEVHGRNMNGGRERHLSIWKSQ